MEKTFSTVRKVIAEIIGCDESDIRPETRFIRDLDADSLDVIDLTYSLGKELDIVMPTKTVLVHGMERCGEDCLLVADDVLTDLGSEFLMGCPNRYDKDQVSQGTSLTHIFENTRIDNWVNLCEAILGSDSRDGDTLITEYTDNFLRTVAENVA